MSNLEEPLRETDRACHKFTIEWLKYFDENIPRGDTNVFDVFNILVSVTGNLIYRFCGEDEVLSKELLDNFPIYLKKSFDLNKSCVESTEE